MKTGDQSAGKLTTPTVRPAKTKFVSRTLCPTETRSGEVVEDLQVEREPKKLAQLKYLKGPFKIFQALQESVILPLAARFGPRYNVATQTGTREDALGRNTQVLTN